MAGKLGLFDSLQKDEIVQSITDYVKCGQGI